MVFSFLLSSYFYINKLCAVTYVVCHCVLYKLCCRSRTGVCCSVCWKACRHCYRTKRWCRQHVLETLKRFVFDSASWLVNTSVVNYSLLLTEISGNENFGQPVGQLCLSVVCRFVCSCQTDHSSTVVFTKLYTQVGTGPRKRWVNLESHLCVDPDLGLLSRIFQHFERGHFSDYVCNIMGLH